MHPIGSARDTRLTPSTLDLLTVRPTANLHLASALHRLPREIRNMIWAHLLPPIAEDARAFHAVRLTSRSMNREIRFEFVHQARLLCRYLRQFTAVRTIPLLNDIPGPMQLRITVMGVTPTLATPEVLSIVVRFNFERVITNDSGLPRTGHAWSKNVMQQIPVFFRYVNISIVGPFDDTPILPRLGPNFVDVNQYLFTTQCLGLVMDRFRPLVKSHVKVPSHRFMRIVVKFIPISLDMYTLRSIRAYRLPWRTSGFAPHVDIRSLGHLQRKIWGHLEDRFYGNMRRSGKFRIYPIIGEKLRQHALVGIRITAPKPASTED